MLDGLEAVIEFNRAIDRNTDYVVPGGYEIKLKGGKTVRFDFNWYEGDIDEKNSRCLNAVCYDLDTGSFEESKQLNRDAISSATKITEFYVYTGEDSDLRPVAVRSLSFSFDGSEDYESLDVSQKLLNAINFEGQ